MVLATFLVDLRSHPRRGAQELRDLRYAHRLRFVPIGWAHTTARTKMEPQGTYRTVFAEPDVGYPGLHNGLEAPYVQQIGIILKMILKDLQELTLCTTGTG